MKYYLTTIQYNKEAKAENRTVPSVFDSLEKAEQKFHEQVGKDMANVTLGGSINYITDSNGGFYSNLTKKWGFMEEAPIEPIEE